LLYQKCYQQTKKAPGTPAMQDALNTLNGMAICEGVEHAVAVRVAQFDDAIYYDLCDPHGQSVKVTADGWHVVNDPPVMFLRKRGMQPLPKPKRGGSVDGLRPLINAHDDETWKLMICWVLGALRPKGPYAALGINGEQGSAKSTTCRMLRRLIDPNEADLRAIPRDDRDLMIAATNSWIVALDNLSNVSASTSDSLCRLATGGGFATRELYSDDGEKLFNAARPILFNGIEELATRPDLLERSIVLNLPPIPESKRMSEKELWQKYELIRPLVLGALFDAVSAAIRNLPSVNLSRRPRMADFAEWVVAGESALPWSERDFLAAYLDNRNSASNAALEASAVGPAIQRLMKDEGRWQGSATELLRLLDGCASEKTKKRPDWPRTPNMLSNALRRIAPTLRQANIRIKFDRKPGGNRARMIVLKRRRKRSP
jgi:hypothetical protein